MARLSSNMIRGSDSALARATCRLACSAAGAAGGTEARSSAEEGAARWWRHDAGSGILSRSRRTAKGEDEVKQSSFAEGVPLAEAPGDLSGRRDSLCEGGEQVKRRERDTRTKTGAALAEGSARAPPCCRQRGGGATFHPQPGRCPVHGAAPRRSERPPLQQRAAKQEKGASQPGSGATRRRHSSSCSQKGVDKICERNAWRAVAGARLSASHCHS